MKINNLVKKYKNIKIKIDENVIFEIVKLSNYYEFGARKIEKIIKDKLENIVIDKIIDNKKSVHIKTLDCLRV